MFGIKKIQNRGTVMWGASTQGNSAPGTLAEPQTARQWHHRRGHRTLHARAQEGKCLEGGRADHSLRLRSNWLQVVMAEWPI